MSKMEEIIPLLEEVIQSREFGLPINGTSMQPLLHKDDIAYLIKPNNIKKNDVVLYKRMTGEYVIHRIFKVKKDHFILVGDNQTKLESPIYQSQVIAKMVAYKTKKKKKTISRLTYKIYVFLWRSFIIRRIYFKLRCLVLKIRKSS